MAKLVRRKNQGKSKRGRYQVHPYEEWYERTPEGPGPKWLELRRGKDFDCSIKTIAVAIWDWSRKHEKPLIVSQNQQDGKVFLQRKVEE